jgi:NAD(P)-dependent dehydrogenase (short-subunit alcohol dehydrogenase family)
LINAKNNGNYSKMSLAELVTKRAGAYAASKAGLEQFAKTVALEEASKGIRVNTVNPGFTRTEILLPEEDKLLDKVNR